MNSARERRNTTRREEEVNARDQRIAGAILGWLHDEGFCPSDDDDDCYYLGNVAVWIQMGDSCCRLFAFADREKGIGRYEVRLPFDAGRALITGAIQLALDDIN